MAYFLYSPQNIANIGGVFPKTKDEEFTLGMSEHDGYYLGSIVDINNIDKIGKYFVCFINDDTAAGFRILGATQMLIDPANIESGYRDLTTEEIRTQNMAKNLLLKMDVRKNIENNVGDLADLVADLSKRIDLVERMAVRMAYYVYQGLSVPTELRDAYLPLIQDAVTRWDEGTLIARNDIEDPADIQAKLVVRSNKITEIIRDDYLAKLEPIV